MQNRGEREKYPLSAKFLTVPFFILIVREHAGKSQVGGDMIYEL